MAGTIPVAGNLTMENLAATLTSEEQLGFVQLTGLAADTNAIRNLAIFINQPTNLGPLAICASGIPSAGTKVLSTSVYVSGAQTQVDIYRLPL
jgi:hypothetical protein